MMSDRSNDFGVVDPIILACPNVPVKVTLTDGRPLAKRLNCAVGPCE
jgi:hypothetical protein